MSQFLRENMHRLLSELDYKEGMRNFKKSYYEDFFNDYRDRVKDVNEAIMNLYGGDDEEGEFEEAADALIAYAKEKYMKFNRFTRGARFLDMQCMLVFYLLPSLMKNGNTEKARYFAEKVVSKWKEAFPKSEIKAASYDEIYSGFKTTILGFNAEGLFDKWK